MLTGIIMAIIGYIKFKNMLKKCLVVDPSTDVELFEYKGKVYDKNKYIQLNAESLKRSNTSQKELKKSLAELESGLVNSKNPDLQMALIEAYKKVIE